MFRGATRSDLPEILKIYARAREVMAAAGNPAQWGTSFPPEELLKEDIDSNRLFVYLVNGELEAVFAFILGPDPCLLYTSPSPRDRSVSRIPYSA